MRAEIIADSISPSGDRVTTMEVSMHRFVLAEFNTHRVFSRNSASSRAIPFKKQVNRVRLSPAAPISFPLEQPGMQGGEEVSSLGAAFKTWTKASEEAAHWANELHKLGVHKSVCNRLLEPFLYHTVIVTSTEWENFFKQRCSPLAQPEIRVVAEEMREALNGSEPKELALGEWHTPYIQYDEELLPVETKKQMSAARCARVSYLTHDGVRDRQKDFDLFDKLISADPGHWSPLEHVCTPQTPEYSVKGNLKGWRQLRHDYENSGS